MTHNRNYQGRYYIPTKEYGENLAQTLINNGYRWAQKISGEYPKGTHEPLMLITSGVGLIHFKRNVDYDTWSRYAKYTPKAIVGGKILVLKSSDRGHWAFLPSFLHNTNSLENPCKEVAYAPPPPLNLDQAIDAVDGLCKSSTAICESLDQHDSLVLLTATSR